MDPLVRAYRESFRRVRQATSTGGEFRRHYDNQAELGLEQLRRLRPILPSSVQDILGLLTSMSGYSGWGRIC